MAYPSKNIDPRQQVFGQSASLSEEAPSLKVLARMAVGKVQTTNDTQTNIVLAPGPTLAEVFPVDSLIHVEAIVTASNGADKGGSWHLEGTFRTPSTGSIVQIGTTTVVHNQETDAGLDALLTPLPNSPAGLVAVQAVGIDGLDFDWAAMVRYVVSTTISD